jgi:hypothetical protein
VYGGHDVTIIADSSGWPLARIRTWIIGH